MSLPISRIWRVVSSRAPSFFWMSCTTVPVEFNWVMMLLWVLVRFSLTELRIEPNWLEMIFWVSLKSSLCRATPSP